MSWIVDYFTGERLRVADAKRLNKLIRKDSEVVEQQQEAVEGAGDTAARLSPLHNALVKLWSQHLQPETDCS